MSTLFEHGMGFEEPNTWEVCGDLFFMAWEWVADWDAPDLETLCEGGWYCAIEPWQIDGCHLLLWGTVHAYGEPMGLLGGPSIYTRQTKEANT